MDNNTPSWPYVMGYFNLSVSAFWDEEQKRQYTERCMAERQRLLTENLEIKRLKTACATLEQDKQKLLAERDVALAVIERFRKILTAPELA